MRSLHVAALPFPTVQGTQAAIRAMLEALAAHGHDVHLLCYAHAGYDYHPPFVVHRLPDFPREHSVRSGPSLRKVALDARLAVSTRSIARVLSPDVVVAHHVEALAACELARVQQLIYFAHTRVAPELPTYWPRLPKRPIEALVAPVERRLWRGAKHVAAISPTLARELGSRGVSATYLPTPWPTQAPCVRRGVSGSGGTVRMLYAGNLDRYQGWEDLVEAVALAPELALLVATTSDTAPLLALSEARKCLNRIAFLPLRDDADRRAAADTADVAVVPRRIPGGLPIKMLDALARGLPVVATRRATAGLDLAHAAVVIDDDSPSAWIAGVTRAARDGGLGDAGRAWLAQHHAPAEFVSRFERLVLEMPRPHSR